MSDYTKLNIYRKQMQALGLNAKQYAKLIDMPYEVVKDIIYEKEGEYSMEIGNLLRKDMFKKHQEIEQNFEQAKIDTEEIKLQEQQVDPMKWYQDEYTLDMIKEKINSTSTPEFARKYNITLNGKKISSSTIYVILSKNKKCLEKMNSKTLQICVEQLYEIFNGDETKYLNKKNKKILHGGKKVEKVGIEFNWYNNWRKEFNIKDYLYQNNITRMELAKKIGIDYSSLTKALLGTQFSVNTVKKLYNYFNNVKKENNDIKSETIKQAEIVVPIIKNEITNNNDLLRKILIDRLTDQEKELIRIFGGKID